MRTQSYKKNTFVSSNEGNINENKFNLTQYNVQTEKNTAILLY